MAQPGEQSLFKRLRKLFSTDVIIRNVGGKQLKVIDTERVQSSGNIEWNRRVDRYNRLYTPVPGYTSDGNGIQLVQRIEVFRDYEAMDADSIIASALDIYADECLHGDTIIPLLDGRRVTIKELYDNQEQNFWLYGLDEDGSFKPVQAQKVAHNGVKRLYAVTMDDGTVIKCTANHIWISDTGEQLRTQDLSVGSSIYALSTKISESKNMEGYEQIWNKNKYEFTHRLVARKHEQLINQRRQLAESGKSKDSFVIHHKAFEKTNNDPTQLEWMHWRDHNEVHAKFNRDLWSGIKDNPKLLADYREKHARGIRNFWSKDRTTFAEERAQSLKAYYANLTADERRAIYGHGGTANGMCGRGHIISGANNGRYDHSIDRLENIDVDRYLHILRVSGSNNPRKAIQTEFNLNRKEYLRINKALCRRYGCSSVKQLINTLIAKDGAQFIKELRAFCKNSKNTKPMKRIRFGEFCQSQGLTAKQGRRILTAAGYNTLTDLVQANNHRVVSIEDAGYADVYDIVNAGDNHIYAIEAADGSKMYTHNCTTKNEYGDIIEINTGNDKVKEVLHNLFYDILNVDFNLWPWVRNLCKYGDFFLILNIAEKFGIVNVEPASAYEMIRLEGSDPNNPNKIVFKRDYSGYGGAGYVSRQEELYDNYEVIHFRMLSDTNFLPYGRSLLEPGRRVYKQLMMMEDAMLIHRIMRAPDKRIFKIDIGNIPPNEVDAYIERIANQMKKTPYVDPNTGEYNLKFNLMNMIEDFYLPVRGTESGTNIENLTGLQYDSIADIDYLKNRLLASLKIPKAYLGYEEDTTGKSTLASQDFRFARTIERIQRIIESELTKLAIIHLYAQGFQDDDLVDFAISLSPASTVFEREKIELWTSKVTLAGDMMDKKLFSKRWIYENIFHMSDDDYLREIDGVVDDMKYTFRLSQIESEGNDPAKTGMSFGTPHDIASLYKGGGKDDVPAGYDEREIPEGGWPGAGRPESHTTYGKHKHPLGWDPLGNKFNKKTPYRGSVKEYKNKTAKSAVESLFRSSAQAKKGVISELYSASNKKDLLDESNLLDNKDS